MFLHITQVSHNINISISIVHPYSQTEGALQSNYNMHLFGTVGMTEKSSIPNEMQMLVVSF